MHQTDVQVRFTRLGGTFHTWKAAVDFIRARACHRSSLRDRGQLLKMF